MIDHFNHLAFSQFVETNPIYDVTDLCKQVPHQIQRATYAHMINFSDTNEDRQSKRKETLKPKNPKDIERVFNKQKNVGRGIASSFTKMGTTFNKT